ncbi:MAG: HAD family hydrolase [Chloroflexi bacterium]|nr:HAD family hydrolase [Chloroflexota bacterium]
MTLLRATVASRDAMTRAFAALTGVVGAFADIRFAGRTDRWIAQQAAASAGVALDDALFAAFAAAYADDLRTTLATQPCSALPGAAALLAALSTHDAAPLGVATGNLRATAALKIVHAGLDAYLAPSRGGYGDLHAERPDVLRAAVEACTWPAHARVVVIGDSEHDVTAAHAIGATAVGVATGARSEAELRAAGAAATLPGLRDTAAALRLLLEI